ncbi:hypothetical protein Tco_1038344, partial [Tanacetum coccineum]
MDDPTIFSHPLPIQSHHSMDITLTLSLINPLDYMLETQTPSPPLPPPSPVI